MNLPRAVNQYEHRIEELAAQIVNAVIDKGECDFIEDIAGEMPSFVIADLMGLPLADGGELYRLTEVIIQIRVPCRRVRR